jgi:hypothetical protein
MNCLSPRRTNSHSKCNLAASMRVPGAQRIWACSSTARAAHADLQDRGQLKGGSRREAKWQGHFS